MLPVLGSGRKRGLPLTATTSSTHYAQPGSSALFSPNTHTLLPSYFHDILLDRFCDYVTVALRAPSWPLAIGSNLLLQQDACVPVLGAGRGTPNTLLPALFIFARSLPRSVPCSGTTSGKRREATRMRNAKMILRPVPRSFLVIHSFSEG